jgi:hypothetical protein
MTEDEAVKALDAFRQGWPYVPMPDVQARRFVRLFEGYPVPLVAKAIDDLIRIHGAQRPAPAEMGELLRSLGKSHFAAAVARRPILLHELVKPEDLTPPDEFEKHMAELRARLVKS